MSQSSQSTLPALGSLLTGRAANLPRYFSWPSWLLVAAYVYFNTSLSFELNGPPRANSSEQLAIFALFCVAWFGWVGLNLSNAVFATVALGPAILVEGYGYLFFPFAALTPADLMKLLTIGLWLGQKPRLIWRGYSRLAVSLCGACALSAVVTLNPSFLGSVLRLFLSVWYVWIIFSESGMKLKCAFVDGLLFMPVTTLSYLGGVNGLWRFISFGEGRALNPFSTGEVLYGSHEVVIYLIFLIPLMTRLGRKKLVLPLLVIIVCYMVFSLSRSLFVAAFAAFLIYFFVNIKTLRRGVSTVLLAILFVGLVFGVSQVGFFSFTEDGVKAGSNAIRFAKMASVLDSYMGKPLLGVGFGAVGVLDSKTANIVEPSVEKAANYQLQGDIKASSEFTPLQILAETGTIGGALSVWLLLFAGRRCLSVLRSPSVPNYVQLALYAWIIFFVTGFVGSNVYHQLITSLAFPVAAYEAFLRPYGVHSGSLIGRRYAFQVSPSQQS